MENLLVVAATVLQQILVWKPVLGPDTMVKQPLIYPVTSSSFLITRQAVDGYLNGHRGAVFKIRLSSDGNRLLTVSDDRALRVWHKTDPASNGSLFECVTVAFGHTARPWDVCLLEQFDLIATVGEDSVGRLWTVAGQQLAVFEGHRQRGVWCLAVQNSGRLLVTGGEDSTVRLWSLNDWISLADSTPPLPRLKTELRLVIPMAKDISNSNDSITAVVAVQHPSRHFAYACTTLGCVYALGSDETLELIHADESMRFDSIAADYLPSFDVTVSGSLVLLGGSDGHCVLIHSQQQWSRKWLAHSQRITNVFIPSTSGIGSHPCLFTSDASGTLKCWMVNLSTLEVYLRFEYKIPIRDRICCLLIEMPSQLLFCGDGKGSIHIYHFDLTTPVDATVVCSQPIYTFVRAHNKSRVTDLKFLYPDPLCSANGQSIKSLWSCGRDGSVCQYQVETDFPAVQLIRISVQKLKSPFMNVERLMCLTASQMTVLVSHTNHLLIWDLIQDGEMDRIDLEGPRRPCDAMMISADNRWMAVCGFQNTVLLKFADKRRSRSVDAYPRAAERVLHVAYHGRLTLVATWVPSQFMSPSPLENDGNLVDSTAIRYLVTGSEDTTLNLLSYAPNSHDEKVRNLQVATGHPSSVRSLAWSKHLRMSPLLFSAGGKTALIAWKLTVTQTLGRYVPRLQPITRCQTQDLQNDYRILSMHAAPITLSESGVSSTQFAHIVVAGMGDSTLDVYIFDELSSRFTKLKSLDIESPALCVKLMMIPEPNSVDNRRYIACTGHTNGKVVFTDLTYLLDLYFMTLGSTVSRRVVCEQVTESALLSVQVHQSGVNCVAFVSLDPSDPSSIMYRIILCTGGDDQSVCCMILTASWIVNPTGNRIVLDPSQVWSDSNEHYSAVKGLQTNGQWACSVSADQRLVFWKVVTVSASPSSVPTISLEKRSRVVLEVSDVSCLAWNEEMPADDDGADSTISLAVGGQGLQLLTVRPFCNSNDQTVQKQQLSART
eukprot:GILJ01012543.1.p1 GENE.GILJ01012543.1~~GILJ01012543.1.p1  ORF type:complete len:1160 (-),score=151.97 GILJ01012543.1:122-3121(-)